MSTHSGEQGYQAAFESAFSRALEISERRLSELEVGQLCSTLAERTPGSQNLLLRNSRLFGHKDVCLGLIRRSFALRYSDTQEMLQLAWLALRSAGQLSVSDILPSFVLADMRAAAWLAVANALRVNNRPRAAEHALEHAEPQLAEGSGDPLLRARFEAYRAALRVDQRRYDEAGRHFRRAERAALAVGASQLAAEILVAKGRLLRIVGDTDEAIQALHRALVTLGEERDPHLVVAAVQLLARALDQKGLTLEAIAVLREATPLMDHPLGELNNLRVRWLEGYLLNRLGHRRAAATVFDAVRRVFLARDLPYDAILASLDLAGALLADGRREELLRLLTEMAPWSHSEDIHPEARRALVALLSRAGEQPLTRDALELASARVESASRFRKQPRQA